MTSLALCHRALTRAERREIEAVRNIPLGQYARIRESAEPPEEPGLRAAWRVSRLIDRLNLHFKYRERRLPS